MSGQPITNVVIAGGGTAGWMCAAALSFALPKTVTITLVESDDIGTVGVGEATIPPIVEFNRQIGVDENAFLKATHGTFKLGIVFENWGRHGHRYMHPFGPFGIDMRGVSFHQYFMSQRLSGQAAGRLDDYNLSASAAALGHFLRPAENAGEVMARLKYAFHFDAKLYALYLRNLSEQRGVKRVEGRIDGVSLRPDDGYVASLELESGLSLGGDLFIDCTGFRGLIIEETLKSGYESWQHWLPCDRAWAVPTELNSPPAPYTQSIAESAGWRWRIPLQHRAGNGYVFASAFIDEAMAQQRLLETVEGRPIDQPRLLKFATGRRRKIWVKNCVAIGLSSGFLEPLESTSIHLIQRGITKLLAFFPDTSFPAAERDEYNAQAIAEIEQVRDFIIAHYKVTERTDTPFWAYCRSMAVPDSLSHKIELFRHRGRLVRHNDDLFAENSWLAVLYGQGIVPRGFDPLVSAMPGDELESNLKQIRDTITRAAQGMPSHQAFIERYCRAQ